MRLRPGGNHAGAADAVELVGEAGGQDAVDAAGEDQVDHVGRAQDWRLGDEDHVAVAEPGFVAGDRPFAVQAAADVDLRRQEPPVFGPAKDDDLPQVAADVPAASEGDRLHKGGRYDEIEAAGLADFAD